MKNKISVNIKNDKLVDLIIFLKNNKKINLLNSPYNWVNDKLYLDPSEGNEKVSQFFTVASSINFRFWKLVNQKIYHPEGIKGELQCIGSTYMFRCLKSCVDNNEYPILNASFLSKISYREMKRIFESDDGKDVIFFLNDRLKNWKNLGKVLLNKYNGQFYNLIKKANNSIEKYIELSKDFRAFDDPVCKLAIVNAIFLQGRGITKFKNIYPGIDYHLQTQILRMGLLLLDENLNKKLKNKLFLNSSESLVLRSKVLECLLTVSKELNVTGDVIDNIFWMNGKKNCTFNAICQHQPDVCVFEKICDKNLNYFMPLERTRYY